MKILFLQLWYDLYGGVETVNDTLASQFIQDGYDVSILCLWECGKNEFVFSGKYQKEKINIEPKRPSYKDSIYKIVHGKLKLGFKQIFSSLACNIQKRKDFNKFSNRIRQINPDFIIVSNHKLISFVPKEYLSKCVMHMHSNVYKYICDKKEKKFLIKYQSKIKKVIWLTNNFAKAAIDNGISNSSFINNPVRIRNNKNNQLINKNIAFIGRLSAEKRVDLLSEIFKKSQLSKAGWKLNIYGTGQINNICISDGVNLKGSTKDVKKVLLNSSVLALTSSTEGFPMVVLEAYECGVPVIAYNYGISASELIKDGNTGYIIPFDDENLYINKLNSLCNDIAKRQEMGKNAKKFVFNFYPENIAKQWYRLFKGDVK